MDYSLPCMDYSLPCMDDYRPPSDPIELAPGAALAPVDLEAALLALLLRQGRAQLPVLRRLAADAPGRDALDGLRTDVDAVGAVCAAAAEALERAYLIANQNRVARAAQRERQGAFLASFRARLVCVGSDEPPQAWSHLGWQGDDPAWPVGLSRDGGQVILAAGVQGSGKSVFGTVIAEGAAAGEPLGSGAGPPTAAVFFHIEEHDRTPQLLDGLRPNPEPADLQLLAARLGVGGAPLGRLRLAVPPSLLPGLQGRLVPYEDLGLEVRPLRVRLPELGQPGLEAALGAEDGARFVRRMLEDAQDQGAGLTLDRMRRFVDDAEDLNAAMRRSAHARLRLLEEIAGTEEDGGLWTLFQPGVTTVVYLGGPHMGHGRVAPLLVGLLGGLLMPSPVHGAFQRVITIDEINLLARDEAVWPALVRTARLVRHRAATLVLMGQDLLCVPDELFGLAGLCAVFQQRSPRIFEHIRERTGALRGVRFDEVSGLGVGEALLAATHATAPAWRQGCRRVRVRPPRCRHGGGTRSAV